MRLNFSVFASAIKNAMSEFQSDEDVINLLYGSLVDPLDLKGKNGLRIYIDKGRASNIMNHKEDVQRVIREAIRSINITQITQYFQQNIKPHMDQDSLPNLISVLKNIIESDRCIDAEEKITILQINTTGSPYNFLAQAFLCALKQNNTEGRKVRTARNPRNQQYVTRNVDHQTIYKKCCEAYSQLINNYTIEELLIPSQSAEVTGCCQVIGDGGSGKTTFLIQRFGRLLASYKNIGIDSPCLPIYIPLNQYKGIAIHGENFIKNYIATNYAGITSHEFVWASCNFYLMLDGANESPYTSQLGKEIQDLVALGCTILITSRYKLDWNCLKTFSCVKLNDLDDEVIKEVLVSKHFPMAEGRLLQTLRRPMWLALYSGLKDIEGINTPGEILHEHHNWLLSKVSSDLQGEKYTEQYRNALAYISKLATLTKAIVFNIKDIEDEIKAFLPETLQVDTFLRIVISSGLIKLIGPDSYNGGVVYQWSHECFWDYYKAYSIFGELGQGIIPPAINNSTTSIPVASFLGDLFMEYRFETKNSCNSDMSPVEAWLQNHMRHDDIGSNYTDECRQMATRNLIEVMKIARRNHVTACYDGLDLSLTQFYDCALPNSSFDNAIVPESTIISQGHTSQIRHLAYLQVNNLLITAGDDNQVLFWNTKTSTVKRRVKTPSRIAGLDISPDNLHILILLETSRPAIMIVPITDDSKKIVINAPDGTVEYSFAKFAADSTRVICASKDGLIHVLDAETGGLVCPSIQVEQGFYGAPIEYGISFNRQFLVNGTTGGNIEIRKINDLDKPTTTFAYTPEDDHHVHNIAFTKNSRFCVVKNYDHLIALNIKAKKDCTEQKTISKEVDLGKFMFQFVPSEDGVFFLNHGSACLHFWDISDNQFIIKDFPCNLSCMALSADSKLLVLADEKGKLYFINSANLETVHTMWVGYTPKKTHYLHNRHHLGSEDILFRRTWAGFFELYNRKQSQFTRIPIQPDPILETTTAPFWENWYCVDDYLCYVDGGVCSIWDMSSGNFVQDLELKGYRIDAVIPQKDLIVGCNYLDSDYPICLWTLSTGKPLASLDTHGTWVCGVPINAEPIKIQSGNFWNKISKFANVYGLKKEYFTHATFSDLGIVVGGTENGTIRIWDLTSQQLVHEENIAASRITKLTTLAKSTIVVIQTEDRSVVIYDVAGRCSIGCWKDNANVLRSVRFLKFIPRDNCNYREELVERDVMGATVYRLYLGSGTLVSYEEDTCDENIAVSQNGEWVAVNKFLQPPLPYKLVLYSVQNDEMVSIPLTMHKLWPNCAFSPSCDGKYFLISNEAGAVYLLDILTGKQLYEWKVCDTKDIYGCSFTNAILVGKATGNLIQMNGGIL